MNISFFVLKRSFDNFKQRFEIGKCCIDGKSCDIKVH